MRILVSGGFDPLHVGHLEYIEQASLYGEVIVALNSDEWLMRKKGYVFMPQAERHKILMANKNVSHVLDLSSMQDADGTICDFIRRLPDMGDANKIDLFAKGGDRFADNTPELDVCVEMGIPVLFGLGRKIQSSSDLVEKLWGSSEIIDKGKDYTVTKITIKPGKAFKLVSSENKQYWIDTSTSMTAVVNEIFKEINNDHEKDIVVIGISVKP